MPVPTPDLPKHHYVPVFYLKQWTGPNGRLIAFRRPFGDKVVATPKPPKKTGYVNGLYWLHGIDPAVANAIEEIVMGHIDNNAAIAHQFILQDNVGRIPPSVRLAWTRFIVGLLIRSPASIRNVYERMMNPSQEERREIKRITKGLPDSELSAVAMQRMALVTIARLTQSPAIERVINRMRWGIYNLTLPELRFFTSDRPVVMTNGVGRKGGHLAIPVSPQKLFLAFNDEAIEREIRAKSPWEISETVNHQVVRRAIDAVWDVDNRRLPYVQRNMSADAALDRNFFSMTK